MQRSFFVNPRCCWCVVAALVGLWAVGPAAWAQGGDPLERIAAHAAAPTPTPTADAPRGDTLPLGLSSARRGHAGAAPTPGEVGGGYLLSTAGALGLVIGLVLAVRWVIVKVGGRPLATGTAAVELLSRTAIAPKSHVLLLRVGQRVMVVSDSAGVLRPLGDIDHPDEVAGLLAAVTASRPGSVTQSFGGVLDRFNRDHDAAGDPGDRHAGAARDALSGLKSRVNSLGGA